MHHLTELPVKNLSTLRIQNDFVCFFKTVNLMFLMSFWAVNRATSEGAEALQMALHTLRMMALGGIHDHVAQVKCGHT